MILLIEGQEVDVKHIRVHRDALKVVFYARVGAVWVSFVKGRNKQLPTYDQLSWPDPQHMFGWSEPYKL